MDKLGFNYDSQESWDAVHGLSESFQYFLLKASNKIAQEKGSCEYYNRTKYSQGLLPIDHYKKDVDKITSIPCQHNWEELRNRNVSNCNQHERQIREVHAARHQNMMNIFNAMAIGVSVSESRTPYNQNNNSTTNNYYVAPQPLPPVIITPPNTIPKK